MLDYNGSEGEVTVFYEERRPDKGLVQYQKIFTRQKEVKYSELK